jgi:hypothetical protein
MRGDIDPVNSAGLNRPGRTHRVLVAREQDSKAKERLVAEKLLEIVGDVLEVHRERLHELAESGIALIENEALRAAIPIVGEFEDASLQERVVEGGLMQVVECSRLVGSDNAFFDVANVLFGVEHLLGRVLSNHK